jgi:hypothetical protein
MPAASSLQQAPARRTKAKRREKLKRRAAKSEAQLKQAA